MYSLFQQRVSLYSPVLTANHQLFVLQPQQPDRKAFFIYKMKSVTRLVLKMHRSYFTPKQAECSCCFTLRARLDRTLALAVCTRQRSQPQVLEIECLGALPEPGKISRVGSKQALTNMQISSARGKSTD
jgi:hypothetical protein